ncbi:MAG: hypothetical protein AAB250_02750, partial [Bdellovibrionota bacterium]
MMSKLLSILVAVALAMTAIACSNKKKDKADEAKSLVVTGVETHALAKQPRGVDRLARVKARQ